MHLIRCAYSFRIYHHPRKLVPRQELNSSRKLSHYFRTNPLNTPTKQFTKVRHIGTKPEITNNFGLVKKLLIIGLSFTVTTLLLNQPKSKDKDNTDMGEMEDHAFRLAIRNLVETRDTEALINLIQQLKARKDHKFLYFHKIDQTHLWEIDIRDELIKARDLELIKFLFPLFCDQTLSYTDVFFDPISRNDLELVKALVEGGMKPLIEKTNYTDVFMYALYHRHVDIAKFLLETGLYNINGCYSFTVQVGDNVGHYSCDSITPAYLAVVLKDLPLLKRLIEWGANVNIPNQRPLNADKYRMADLDYHNPLTYSIEKNLPQFFYFLLTLPGVDLNYRCSAGRTPLMVALHEGREKMALQLIQRKVEVNGKDAFGNTPLELGARSVSPAVFEALIQADPNLNITDKWENNLWHQIVNNPNIEEISPLLIKGGIHSLINREAADGETPLARAIDEGNANAVSVLLTYGADPTQKMVNLNSYKLSLLKIDKNEPISVLDFALRKLEYLKKYPESDYQIAKSISETVACINLLQNPPPVLAKPPQWTPSSASI